MDLIYIAAIAVFFGLCAGLVLGCAKLYGRTPGGRS